MLMLLMIKLINFYHIPSLNDYFYFYSLRINSIPIKNFKTLNRFSSSKKIREDSFKRRRVRFDINLLFEMAKEFEWYTEAKKNTEEGEERIE